MYYSSRKEDAESVVYLLKERLIKEQIDPNEIKFITLIDNEGTVWSKDFEDEFLILDLNENRLIFEAVFHAKNENVWFLYQHGKLYNQVLKRDFSELILLCYQTMAETIKQVEIIGARVIAEKIYHNEKEYWNDKSWKYVNSS